MYRHKVSVVPAVQNTTLRHTRSGHQAVETIGSTLQITLNIKYTILFRIENEEENSYVLLPFQTNISQSTHNYERWKLQNLVCGTQQPASIPG